MRSSEVLEGSTHTSWLLAIVGGFMCFSHLTRNRELPADVVAAVTLFWFGDVEDGDLVSLTRSYC